MDLKESLAQSRLFIVSVVATLFVLFVTIALIVVRNLWLTIRLSDICPDYFAAEYAYVVDGQGRGMDSVAVTLRDNSNINMIYRTFTDSTGRFMLFNDFGSFALSRMPFSYFLIVALEGWSDTIRYEFERHRGCHFRRTSGPDTIVCSNGRGTLSLRLEKVGRTIIDSGLEFVGFEESALSRRLPQRLSTKLPFDSALYTTGDMGGMSVPFAVVKVRDYRIMGETGELLTEGTYYLFDRDNDNDLVDEKPLLFTTADRRRDNDIVDCTVRTCSTVDSICTDRKSYVLELRLRGMESREPILQYRRMDAVEGTLHITPDMAAQRVLPDEDNTKSAAFDTMKYRCLLWDRRGLDYSDRAAIVMAIDRDRDGKFDCREGSVEMYERLTGRIVLDSISFVIDTVSGDGMRLFCDDVLHNKARVSNATPGAWSDDFIAAATCPVSLYRECSANRYVLLYFFEGVASIRMEDAALRTLVTLMRDRLGPVALIGINRRSAGELYSNEPVINENRGWRGPLVMQFHNHRSEELVCLDNGAAIVYRGPVNEEAVETIWQHAGLDENAALALFNWNSDPLQVDGAQAAAQ